MIMTRALNDEYTLLSLTVASSGLELVVRTKDISMLSPGDPVWPDTKTKSSIYINGKWVALLDEFENVKKLMRNSNAI